MKDIFDVPADMSADDRARARAEWLLAQPWMVDARQAFLAAVHKEVPFWATGNSLIKAFTDTAVTAYVAGMEDAIDKRRERAK